MRPFLEPLAIDHIFRARPIFSAITTYASMKLSGGADWPIIDDVEGGPRPMRDEGGAHATESLFQGNKAV